PPAPTLSVINNCDGTSTLTVTGATGSLTWSDGSTAASPRTVNAAGTFTVTQTVGGCTSVASNSVTAAPQNPPPVPTLSVINNCDGTSTLTVTGATGSLTWSDGSTAASPRTVNAAGTFTVTQTVGGCTSVASISVTAAPQNPPPAPTLSVIN